MLKEFFLNEVKNGINKAISAGKLGSMGENDEFSLIIEKPKNADFGDFAVNVSSLARVARIAPPMIANAIVENLAGENYTTSVVGGFINFKIENSLLANSVAEILINGENYGRPQNVPTEKILLEYVSANPTGPFHIGHGRWAAMGSALANLLMFYGHEVHQEFYINDAGSQIQKLGNSLRIRIGQELGEDIDFPTDEIEKKIEYAVTNKSLVNVFSLKKSLTYYESATSANQLLLDKLRNDASRIGFRTEELEFLEDIGIENKQCDNLAKIYAETLENMSDARTSVASNNLSIIMKYLAVINIVFMPLTVITGIGGMSEFTMMTEGIWWPHAYAALVVVMVIIGFVTYRLVHDIGAPRNTRRR